MAEIIVRFVVWVIVEGLFELLERIGRAIARFTIPVLTAGRVRVAPPPGNLVMVKRWHGLHHLTDGSPIMGEGLAAIAGLLILAAALVRAAFAIAALRA